MRLSKVETRIWHALIGHHHHRSIRRSTPPAAAGPLFESWRVQAPLEGSEQAHEEQARREAEEEMARWMIEEYDLLIT